MAENDQTPADVHRLLAEQLADPAACWSAGTFGAVAEFARETGESAEYHDLAVSTTRGALAVCADPRIRPVAYERLTPGDGWSHGIALCLPSSECAMHRRTVVTELGPDRDALRTDDREATLFDLGLGVDHLDACVRTAHPETLEYLRAAEGHSLFEPGLPFAARIPELSPHRVFLTRIARAEVYQPVPPPGGTSPDGPHTHILPRLLAARRTHPATEPIPDGWVPVAHIFPSHPTTEPDGRRVPFDPLRHKAFQRLLGMFGDPAQVRAKTRIIDAVRRRSAPSAGSDADPRTIRLALRQLDHTDGESATLRAWHAAYPEEHQVSDEQDGAPPSHPDGH
jgi:hypothetical protein